MRAPQSPEEGNIDPPSFDKTEELVSAIGSGDPAVGLALFDRYADRLFDLAYSCTRDYDDAALLVADVIVESTVTGTLVKTTNLTTWIYAQMREQVMAWVGRRLAPDDRVITLPTPVDVDDPQALGLLLWTALAASSERDHMMITINLRHHLGGEDLAQIMGISQASSELLWATTIETLRTQFSALLALAWLRYGPDPHPEALMGLYDILIRWDGNHTPLVHREAVNRLAERPEISEWVMAQFGDPLAVYAQVPLTAAVPGLRQQVSERLHMAAQLRASAPKPATPFEQEGNAEDADADSDVTIPPGMWPDHALVDTPKTAGTRRTRTRKRPFRLGQGGLIALGYFFGVASLLGYQQFIEPLAFPDGTTNATPTPIAVAETTSPGTGVPGRLTVPTGVLPVEGATSTSMLLANTGGTVLEWEIVHAPEWVETTPTSGTLAPGTTVEVALTLAKVIDDVNQNGHISIKWDGIEEGTAQVDIESRAGQPPQVGELALQPQELSCADPVGVSLDVKDNSGVREVTVVGLTESGKIYSQPLDQQGQGSQWAGTLGPINEPGLLRLSVTAVDDLGNRVEANRGSVTVNPC